MDNKPSFTDPVLDNFDGTLSVRPINGEPIVSKTNAPRTNLPTPPLSSTSARSPYTPPSQTTYATNRSHTSPGSFLPAASSTYTSMSHGYDVANRSDASFRGYTSMTTPFYTPERAPMPQYAQYATNNFQPVDWGFQSIQISPSDHQRGLRSSRPSDLAIASESTIPSREDEPSHDRTSTHHENDEFPVPPSVEMDLADLLFIPRKPTSIDIQYLRDRNRGLTNTANSSFAAVGNGMATMDQDDLGMHSTPMLEVLDTSLEKQDKRILLRTCQECDYNWKTDLEFEMPFLGRVARELSRRIKKIAAAFEPQDIFDEITDNMSYYSRQEGPDAWKAELSDWRLPLPVHLPEPYSNSPHWREVEMVALWKLMRRIWVDRPYYLPLSEEVDTLRSGMVAVSEARGWGINREYSCKMIEAKIRRMNKQNYTPLRRYRDLEGWVE